MKKILSMLVVLCLMLAPVMGMAADFENFNVYEDPNDRFAFAYPGDWILLSKETIDEAIAMAETMLDEESKALFQSIVPQVEQLGLIVLTDATMQSNINLICQDVGGELTTDFVLAVAQPALEQMRASLNDFEIVDEPYVLELEDKQAVIMSYMYSMADTYMVGVQANIGAGSNLYSLTLTMTPENTDDIEVLDFVLCNSVMQ